MGIRGATDVGMPKRVQFLLVGPGALLLFAIGLGPTPAVRGAYGSLSPTEARAAGLNAVNCLPSKKCLDAAHSAGLKAVVWEGSYSSSRCAFARSDTTLLRDLSALAGHPAILAWQLSDEPGAARAGNCPQVVTQHRQRTELIHRYDKRPTYTVISTWDTKEAYPYEYWASATDIVGIDVYVCHRRASEPVGTSRCDFSAIDRAIARANRYLPHYWAVMQAFGACFSNGDCYSMPQADQLRQQFRRWSASRMEGFFIYDWTQQAPWMVEWCSQKGYCPIEVLAHNL